MAYDEFLADRIRNQLKTFPQEFIEKKMFGGLSFLLKGKMTIGIIKEELAVRVIEEKMESELKKPFIRPMDFTKKPLKEFIYVSGEGFDNDKDLNHYIVLGIEHALSKL